MNPSWTWCVVWLLALAAFDRELGAQQPGKPATTKTLVDPQWQPKQDGVGGHWSVDPQGSVQMQSNQGGFHNAFSFQAQGMPFQPMTTKMTADGNEYLYTGTLGNVSVTRSLRFGPNPGTIRCFDTFTSTAATKINVQMVFHSRYMNQRLVSDLANDLAGNTIGPKDSGFVVHPPANMRNPTGRVVHTPLVWVGSPKGKVRPTLQRQNNPQMTLSYSLDLQPGKPQAMVFGMSLQQLTGKEDAKQMAKAFAVFKPKDWLTDIPPDVRRTIQNYSGGGDSEELSPNALLADVQQMLETLDVEMKGTDVLVVDAETQLRGSVQGNYLNVETPHGKATVPLADIVAIRGGSHGRGVTQVYLKSGEILAGTMSGELVFADNSGLKLDLKGETIDHLFLWGASKSAKPLTEPVVMVELRSGNRIVADGDMQFPAATAWGRIDLTAARMKYLHPVHESQPMHRVVFRDGSQLSVILQGGEFVFNSSRFGPLTVATDEITKLVVRPPASVKSSDSEETPETGEAKQNVSKWNLVGENVLVGELVEREIQISTASGATKIDATKVRSVESGEAGAFAFTLVGGNQIIGRLASPTWRIRSEGKEWTIPARHVVSFRAANFDSNSDDMKTTKPRSTPTVQGTTIIQNGDDPIGP